MSTAPQAGYDVLIVGGGPAGLSAALLLGRACRRVLVVDDEGHRNRPAFRARGFFTREGTPPSELLRIARLQVEGMDVTHLEGRISSVNKANGQIRATLEDGSRVRSREILFATGVVDVLPAVPGLRELWGTSVYHCPYCHGWETRGQRIGLYGDGEAGYKLAALLRGWTDNLTLFTDGPANLNESRRARLEEKNVTICEERVARLIGEGGALEAVELESGERIERASLYLKPAQWPNAALPLSLGCSLDDHGRVEATRYGATGVEGVWVAGDISAGVQQVATAAASGTEAAMMINEELLKREFFAGKGQA